MRKGALLPIDLEVARNKLSPKSFSHLEESFQFQSWLKSSLLQHFQSLPGWEESQAVYLGSWAKGTLCPKSDLDLIFLGESQSVGRVMGAAQAQGLKLRARSPKDLGDWTVGVETFDVLNLLHAESDCPQIQKQLQIQKSGILQSTLKKKRVWLRDLIAERKSRRNRYNSIAQYLEPNLKYGPGGLRDLEQGFSVISLFANEFKDIENENQKMLALQRQLICLRRWVHLHGNSEILLAQDQMELASWLGFKTSQEFMSQVQRTLEESAIFSNWVLEWVQASRSEKESLWKNSRSWKAKSLPSQAKFRNTGISTMAVRRWLDKNSQEKIAFRSDWLAFFNEKMDRNSLQFWFEAGLLELWIPEFLRVKYWVQHDQYHRYSLGTHLLQTVKEVLSFQSWASPELKKIARHFRATDWKILFWTALYHDLGKGLEGDHATVGADLVQRDLPKLKFKSHLIREIAWMVQNHLILSTAAFRRNPDSPKTLRFLAERGVAGHRVGLLILFTAMDIRGTNPEAWNDWKQSLLLKLHASLTSQVAASYVRLLDFMKTEKSEYNRRILQSLDSSLLESIPLIWVRKDLRSLPGAQGNSILVRKEKGRIWVRFHFPEDKLGIFLKCAVSLFSTGASIDQAYVHTLEGLGVYNWFQVKSSRSVSILEQRLKLAMNKPKPIPNVRFSEVKIVSEDPESCLISFRGIDQKGALAVAANSLFEAELVLRWARVHTWGNQIDDLFSVALDSDIHRKVGIIQDQLIAKKNGSI